MNLRRALFIAACTVAVAAGPPRRSRRGRSSAALRAAASQQQPQPVPQQPPRSARSGAAAAGPPCIQDFGKLRDEAQKQGDADPGRERSARRRRKRPAQLFNAFTAAEAKMIKYATDNAVCVRHSAGSHQQHRKAGARQDDGDPHQGLPSRRRAAAAGRRRA